MTGNDREPVPMKVKVWRSVVLFVLLSAMFAETAPQAVATDGAVGLWFGLTMAMIVGGLLMFLAMMSEDEGEAMINKDRKHEQEIREREQQIRARQKGVWNQSQVEYALDWVLDQLAEARTERAAALSILATQSGDDLLDACRQVKQVALSEADNSQTLEDRLRAVVEALKTMSANEWVGMSGPAQVRWCPWCYGVEREMWGYTDAAGHKANCQRQQALRLAEGGDAK